MIWSNTSNDGDDNTGGIYKWTMDALFGRRISPSRRFKEASQDDTNYKSKKSHRDPKKWNGAEYSTRARSSSASTEGAFYHRYDLLQDDDDPEILKPVQRSVWKDSDSFGQRHTQVKGWDFHSDVGEKPLNYEESDSNDTFSGRKQRLHDRGEKLPRDLDNNSLKFRVPNHNDPLISKLFGKETSSPPKALPGKFPSPLKKVAVKPHTSAKELSCPSKDFTAEYLQLLEDLDLNGQRLKQLQLGIQHHHDDQQARESSYREKYFTMRKELISELKQSKRIYDNYYKLYEKYKRLRISNTNATQTQRRVHDLETQVVDASIERAEEVRKLSETIFQLELKQQEIQAGHERERIRYQSRIAELESILRPRLSDSAQTSKAPYRAHLEPQLYPTSFT
ncbi:LANO_0A02652g1_1 [Lachancea nothofagi CBS 11611]|uniref:Spindle pole component BBP1 n=1 Tax=Lachancea nothofagi CBS 11611 TaxID=1266666 RepID=A0A1G4INQ7_9SACH|nr:LANO_0A02652g1_1 [Lachancea nothofagi CBS 11611]